jgi:hypothetical protein
MAADADAAMRNPDETRFGEYVAAVLAEAISFGGADTEILMGRTTAMRHRLSVHRTDNATLEFEFDLPSNGEYEGLAHIVKEALRLDTTMATWVFVILGKDGGLRGISVPTRCIDHIVVEPIHDVDMVGEVFND